MKDYKKIDLRNYLKRGSVNMSDAAERAHYLRMKKWSLGPYESGLWLWQEQAFSQVRGQSQSAVGWNWLGHEYMWAANVDKIIGKLCPDERKSL